MRLGVLCIFAIESHLYHSRLQQCFKLIYTNAFWHAALGTNWPTTTQYQAKSTLHEGVLEHLLNGVNGCQTDAI